MHPTVDTLPPRQPDQYVMGPRSWIALAAVWVGSVAYVGPRINRDWTPHDDGLLAQSAARLLEGQLPHRDFGDAYTGLLTAYHAAAFAVGGQSLLTLRLALLVAFALWVPAFYGIAARFLTPLGAAVATAAAVAWSVPNYSASMPSWYNLFLATAATLAVIRYVETSSRRWLVAAGICTGLSVLVKIVGIYVIVAIGVFLYWRRLDARERPAGGGSGWQPRDWGRAALAVAAAALLSLAVFGLVRRGLTSGTVLHFVIPAIAVSVIVAVAGIRSTAVRWRPLWLDGLAFGAGIALPLGLFVIPYVAAHAVHALITGVLIVPQRRLVSATLAPPLFRDALRAWPVVVVLVVTAVSRGIVRRILSGVTVALGVAALWISGRGVPYADMFEAARATVPIAVCAAAVLLFWPSGPSRPWIERERAVLVVFVAAFFSFIQFPFAAPVYFCYVAPVAILAVVAVTAGLTHRVPATVGGVLLAVALCFAVWRMNTRAYLSLNSGAAAPKPMALLPPPYGGIRVTYQDSVTYTRLAAVLRAHATGDFMFCTPDCPQAYFLTGLRNPTPMLFEFLSESPRDARHTLRVLEERRVGVVAVNHESQFSTLDTAMGSALVRRYPESTDVGPFTVRWR